MWAWLVGVASENRLLMKTRGRRIGVVQLFSLDYGGGGRRPKKLRGFDPSWSSLAAGYDVLFVKWLLKILGEAFAP